MKMGKGLFFFFFQAKQKELHIDEYSLLRILIATEESDKNEQKARYITLTCDFLCHDPPPSHKL